MNLKKIKKYTIVRFHYCRTCGMLDDDKHAFQHFRSNERHGFIVLYYPPKKMIYITPTFSSAGSIDTGVDLYERSFDSDLGWLWYGSPETFYDIANEERDMDISDRKLMPADYNYTEIHELYIKYAQWYRTNITSATG